MSASNNAAERALCSAVIECRYHGRDFTTGEMKVLCAHIAGPPALNRCALSKEFCRRIGWYKPDGGLKDMMARGTMLAMHRDGLIELSPPARGLDRALPHHTRAHRNLRGNPALHRRGL